jgi:hypothetical protein
MRMKLTPNATFDPHDDASAQRDNVAVKKSSANNQQIFQVSVLKTFFFVFDVFILGNPFQTVLIIADKSRSMP